MLKVILILSVSLLPFLGKSQNNPEALGRYLFTYLKEGTISKIDSLVPTIEELKDLAQKIGFNKNSEQYLEVLKGYDSEIEKFRENINSIYSDTLENKLSWSNITFVKVVSISDSMKIDNRDPTSKSVLITKLSIFFVHRSNNYEITIQDAFEINGLWKLGNNIYLSKLD